MVMHPFRPTERSIFWKLDALLFLNNDFVKFFEEQTDLYLRFNDNGEVGPRIVRESYKAYMWGMIISYASRGKKLRITEQIKLEKKIKKLEDYYVTRSDDDLADLKISRLTQSNLITRKTERDILFAKPRFF